MGLATHTGWSQHTGLQTEVQIAERDLHKHGLAYGST